MGVASAPLNRLRSWRAERELRPMIDRARELSMVQEPALRDLAGRVHWVVDAALPGDLVECGVWRGGSAFLMAQVLESRGEREKRVWLFDSLEGLPAPEPIDGERALAYPERKDDPWYHDNCRADVEEVRASARRLGLADRTRIVKGWFEDTLPAHRDEIGPIAVHEFLASRALSHRIRSAAGVAFFTKG